MTNRMSISPAMALTIPTISGINFMPKRSLACCWKCLRQLLTHKDLREHWQG
jgi:hypothetical protein